MSSKIDELSVRKAVKERYSGLATSGSSGKDYASRIGYSGEAVEKLPDQVLEVSAGCGNPTAIADLKPGQTVLDLGSGGGIDVFLSAQAVGSKGKAIGVDATPEMIWRARKAAKEMNATNVEFRLGEIECMPVESNTVDVVISNCVINLSPDKEKAFMEAFRVLRPGGKLAVSDMVLTEDVKADEQEMFKSWASCIGGAIPLDEYVGKMKAAGFKDIEINSRHTYTSEELALMLGDTGCCGSGCGCGTGITTLTGSKALSKVATVKITARKE
ncbi:putative methyltransferase [Methanocella paludicola SANAE]|uniref:Arsenite methyltransferase n=1 Tax=Methanocella paludicola (strain DSM 17711 / JCM 13418 / NBRC 101707 / SANAE) TaxID=304371 RepID=D1YWD9_METPS|nr:arsenite methyltransferase [Methanocella paludicola]BAI60761.1 putative methyltransferase [Methanocella paludicola SANAE]